MEFNINRFINMLKLDLRFLVAPTFLISTFVFFVILSINILALYDSHGTQDIEFNSNYMFLFFISLVVIGSISFKEVGKQNERVNFLNLPTSTLEKTLSKFLSTSVIFPILLIAVFFVFSPLFEGFARAIFSGELIWENTIENKKILFITGLLLTAFFAYGSIKYNTISFVKIILWLIVFIAIIAALNFLLGISLFPELRAEVFGLEHDYNRTTSNENMNSDFIENLGMTAFYLSPLVFWVLTFFALKEKEA